MRDYLITTQGTQHESEQLSVFLQNLSPSLNEKVSISIFSNTVRKNLPLRTAIQDMVRQKLGPSPDKNAFRNLEEALIKPVVKRMDTLLATPDQIIIQKHQEGKALYIVSTGECTVHIS